MRDGGRSSMVEPQIVILVVAGSSPVGHPILATAHQMSLILGNRMIKTRQLDVNLIRNMIRCDWLALIVRCVDPKMQQHWVCL